MANILDGAIILELWAALERPLPKALGRSKPMVLRWAREGWVSQADLEDYFLATDPRLERQDIKALCACFDLPWRTVYPRPRARSIAVYGGKALSVVDAAELLIRLERLGFSVDPAPLTRALSPAVKAKDRITSAELSVLWFDKTRHKMEALSLQVDARAAGARQRRNLKTSTGYKLELWLTETGEPRVLFARAPRYRHRPDPVETVCLQCGETWYRGDPDSSALHRAEHRRRMHILAPKPLPELLTARDHDPDPELVTRDSPAWKHREIYRRAAAFRREFSYDFVQWAGPDGDDDPDARGFIFANPEGIIQGACAFRLRCWEGGERRWGLQWVWIAPAFRRQGLLAARWPEFRRRFGDFHIEGPVSPAMEAFAVKQGDASLLGYAPDAVWSGLA